MGSVPAAAVAAALLARFGEQVCEQAVCLRTSVPRRVKLADVGLPVVVRRFIERYDPIAAEQGLYAHQADVLRPLSTGEMRDTLLTSATGSGKSLALWGFLVQAVTARWAIPRPWPAFRLKRCCGDRSNVCAGPRSQHPWSSIVGRLTRER